MRLSPEVGDQMNQAAITITKCKKFGHQTWFDEEQIVCDIDGQISTEIEHLKT